MAKIENKWETYVKNKFNNKSLNKLADNILENLSGMGFINTRGLSYYDIRAYVMQALYEWVNPSLYAYPKQDEIKKNPGVSILSKEKINNLTGTTHYQLSNGMFISYEPKRYRQHAQYGFKYSVYAPGERAAVYRDWETDRKSTRLNSSHSAKSRMPSSA